MKIKSLIIQSCRVTANNNAVLTFKGVPSDVIAVKPFNSLILSLDDVLKNVAIASPSVLVGSVITVEDTTDIKGNKIEGFIETFKAGDKYVVTENNTVLKDGSINPETNAPYQVGDKAECKTNGVRINGRMNLVVSETVQNMVFTTTIQMAVQNKLASSMNRSSNRIMVAEQHQEPEIIDNDENHELDEAISGKNQSKKGKTEEKF